MVTASNTLSFSDMDDNRRTVDSISTEFSSADIPTLESGGNISVYNGYRYNSSEAVSTSVTYTATNQTTSRGPILSSSFNNINTPNAQFSATSHQRATTPVLVDPLISQPTTHIYDNVASSGENYTGNSTSYASSNFSIIINSTGGSEPSNSTLDLDWVTDVGVFFMHGTKEQGFADNSTMNVTSMDIPQNYSEVEALTQGLGERYKTDLETWILTFVYCAIFITGVVGNICTCIVICKNNYMHTATNYYLFSLAISDVLTLILGKLIILKITTAQTSKLCL